VSHLVSCRTCGETYDPKDSSHDCPGALRDQKERVDALEERLAKLEADHESLLQALSTFCTILGGAPGFELKCVIDRLLKKDR
jgi:hypothetical protein